MTLTVYHIQKLVRNVSIDKFTITNRGRVLLREFQIQSRRLTDSTHKPSSNSSVNQFDSLLAELRVSAKDSMNPDRFEHALKSAFEFLGFKAVRLGGAGKTDILIHSPGSSKVSYSVAVDAKSTASGSVSAGMVDFDSLKRAQEET